MNTRFHLRLFTATVCVSGTTLLASPVINIQLPNGGADTTVYTNKVVLWGRVVSDVPLKTIGWTNITAGSGGTGSFEWVQGGTSGWWRTPAIGLTGIVQNLGVWALDTNNVSSPPDTMAVTFNTNGLPAGPAAYPTGAVFATSLQISQQCPPATLSDINPEFSWQFGDALNAGSPTNLTRINLGSPSNAYTYCVAIGDVTGDGRPDVVAGFEARTVVFVNDGGSQSNWARVNLGNLQDVAAYGLAVGDVTGDGRPDVVVGNNGYLLRSCVLINNGGSPDTWSRVNLGTNKTAYYDYTREVAIADVTGDGRPDVVMVGDNVAGGPQNFVVVNNGGSPDTWSRVMLGSAVTDVTRSMAVADVTGDGLPDVIADVNGYSYVHINNGGSPGTWTRASLGATTYCLPYSTAVGDVTGDGLPDVVLGNYSSYQNAVVVNDGTYPTNWARINLGSVLSEATEAVGIGDVTGDGRLDVVIGNMNQQSYVLINNGGSPATWVRANLGNAAGYATTSIAIGDVTGDGRLDVVMGNNSFQQNFVLVNPPASMPFNQAGYRVQVARSTNALASGALFWDSGITNLPIVGDGCATVRQLPACTNAGDYFIQTKVFASGGYQSDWSTPRKYTIPTNQVYLAVQWPLPPCAYVTNTPCAVRGWMSWNTTGVGWTNLTTQTGGAFGGTGGWTQNVALVAGTNAVRFVGSAEGGLSATQAVALVYLPTAPQLEITSPNGGLSTTTTYFSVQMGGTVSAPLDSWGTTVCWSNLANGAAGSVARTNTQVAWPGTGTITVPLQRVTDNVIRVWCASQLGGVIEDVIGVGCYDPQPPTISIEEPSGGADTTVYVSKVALAGVAGDNGTLASVGWRNVTAGTNAAAAFERMSVGTSAWWRTPPLALAPGAQQFEVWTVDTWDNTSAVDTITVTYNTNGLPANPAAFATGAVYVTALQVERQWPPVTLGIPFPRFSWHFGDALNAASPTGMVRVTLGSPSNNTPDAVVIADMTGDGRPDVLLAGTSPYNMIYLNDGRHPTNWVPISLGRPAFDNSVALGVGDLTGDGRPDVVEGNFNGTNVVVVNNGGAPDTWPRVVLGAPAVDTTYGLAVADVTGDGRLDVIEANYAKTNYVLVNTGDRPAFWPRVALGPAAAFNSRAMAVGDLTGDGRPDVVVGNYNQQNHVLINNGGSPSTWSRVNLGGGLNDATFNVAIADLTGDGRLDVAVGNLSAQNYVLINNGGSPDTWPRVNLGSALSDETRGLVVGDVNGDGLTDVVVANNVQSDYVLINNGGSPDTWARLTLASATNDISLSAAIGDVNDDGRLDVVVGNQGQSFVVLNQASSMPVAQVGYRVQVARSPGELTAGALLWDSGITNLPEIGDGIGTVLQLAACTNSGEYYWRVKVFSAGSCQSDWTDPQRYTIPPNQVGLGIFHPVPPQAYVTNTPYRVDGAVFPNAASLTWTNLSAGGGGAMPVSGLWTQTVALAAGSNTVRFTAGGSGTTVTQTLTMVYLTNTPSVTIATPNGGQDYSTTEFSVKLSGVVTPPLDMWGGRVYWTNDATRLGGVLARTNDQVNWPATGTVYVSLQTWSDNVLRVWCDSQMGAPIEGRMTIGCYDYNPPTVEIRQPNGGAAATVYTDRVALMGTARDNGTLVSVAWRNVTTSSNGAAVIERLAGGTNGWWRTPALPLVPGAQQIEVWAVDTWNNTGGVDTITVTYSTNGVPSALSNFTTGTVYATALQVDRQWPPAAVGNITPAFTWQVGDGVNTGSSTNMLRLNLGSPLTDDTRGLAIGDLDGDGRPDVVVGNNSLQTYALLNTGDNPENWPRLNLGSPAVLPTYAVAIGDITGDGRPDVVLGNYGTQNVVIVNNGGSPDTWLRVNLGSALNDNTWGIAIGDVTGDGRPDVVVGNSGGQDYVLVNDGGNPAGWARVNLAGAVIGTTFSVAIGDLTGDGLPDVALGNQGQSVVAVNNGGSPAAWSRVNLGPVLSGYTHGVTLGDLNGDGRLDAVLARSEYSDQINQVILNNGGSPSNWPAWPLSTSSEYSYGAVIADLNGDGRPDLVFGNNGPDSVYLNDGRAPTNWPRAKLGSGPSDATYAVTVGDLNGDSRPDVVVGNSLAQNIVVLNTTTSMPCTQVGYQVQVAGTAEGLESGSLFWDSGIINRPTVGDGIAAILQDRACTHSGDYYWRVRTFSSSGMQSEWTASQRYTIPTNVVYFSIFRPIPPRMYATNTPLAVAGWLSWNVQTAGWTNLTTGGAGVIAGAGGWTQNVALAAGTNSLRFTASAAGAVTVTQTLTTIYLTNTPSVLFTAPNAGQSFTTTAFSVQMAGTLTTPLDLWGSRVFWTNAAAGVGGVMSRAGTQAVWPAAGTIEVALNPGNDTTIRVWCDSQMGMPIEARLTVGCFDPIIPTTEIRQPNGGRDVTLFTNVVVLTGTAGDNGTLVSAVWSNLATGVGGVVGFERLAGETNGWWRTPVLSLVPGPQQLAVWAIDSWTNRGEGDTITVTCSTNGLPGELAAFPAGAVSATSLQVNRQWPTVTLGDSRPEFSWMFGDSVNNGSPTNMGRVNLGSAQTYQTYVVGAGDLTGDGLPDVVIGNNADPNYVAINNGGSPATWPRVLLGSSLSDLTLGLAIGDVTGDGLPDVVVGNNGQQNYVMVNNGGWPTNWPRVNLGTGLNDSTYSVAVGDVTGDGRPDVVVGNYSQPSYVLVNNGSSPGNWPRSTLGSASNSLTCSVAIGDLTGDGRPDVVVGNYNQPNYVLVNTGTNPAAWSRVQLGSAQNNISYSLAIGDMNDDGRPDVVVGNYGQQKYLLLNNGNSPSNWPRLILGPASVENTFRVGIADLNGDGRPDVVAGNAAQQNTALLNIGGSPSNWPRVNLGFASTDMTYGLAVGDMNRDGRPDVIAGNWMEQSTLLTNNAKAMPFTQVGYRLQVALTPVDLVAGQVIWDSGITNVATTGDGLSSVRQGVPCGVVGSHYWRVKVFSSSGMQSDWTDPSRYDFTFPDAPAVDITNADAQVTADVATCAIGGTNNAFVVGTMWWTNTLSGTGGTFAASSPWAIANIALAAGTNAITVSGSNTTGLVSSDTLIVMRSGGDTDGDGLPDGWELAYFGGITNAVPTAHGDADGMSNWEEFIAGTDPTNTASSLKMLPVATSPTGVVVRWSSATGKLYRLNRATNLVSGFADFKINISAIPATNTETDATAAGKGPYFYRVTVEP